jgi:hypothetical protein
MVVFYDVNDSITRQFVVPESVQLATLAAETWVGKMFPEAEIDWHSQTPLRYDGKIKDHGRYRGGVMVIDTAAVGNNRPEQLIPLIGTTF